MGKQTLNEQASTVEFLQSYLELTSQNIGGPSVEGFVLQHGRPFVPQSLTAEECQYVFRCVERYGLRFPRKQCYYNAQMLLLLGDEEKRLRYCEGWACRTLPVSHGWLHINGKVIDLTMRQDQNPRRGRLADRVLGAWQENRAYFGVTFRRHFVRSKVLDTKHANCLLEDFYLQGEAFLTKQLLAGESDR